MNGLSASFWNLVGTPELPELGPGPRAGVLPLPVLAGRLDAWTEGRLLSDGARLRLRAVAYLHHDHADAAHELVQDLTDAEGALIHAVLHRREPDFWNAKYWFRRVENHPVFGALTRRLAGHRVDEALRELQASLTLTGSVDPVAMVEAIESVARRPASDPEVVYLRGVQMAESECLVEHLAGKGG